MPRGMTTKEFQTAVKRTLKACDGSVTNAARLLGMKIPALSRALNHRGLIKWWTSYKNKLALKRMREKNRRKYQRRKMRGLIESGYDPLTAQYLAAQDGRRRLPFPAPLAQGTSTNEENF